MNPEPDSSSFGPLLRRYRLSAGLSQEALAERASLSADAVGMLERGVRRMPYEQTIERLAAALKLGEDDREKLSSAVRRRRTSRARRFPRRTPLPVPLTPLIGRERDVAVIQSWFSSGTPRLVTISGTGGVGKTRLALAIAHDLRRQFDDDVVFVSLATLTDPENVASALFACLDRNGDGTPASLAAFCAQVGNRRVLFVIDNLEHVLAGGALLCEFLERCPEAVALVTSREALHVRGEREFAVEPLELTPAVELLIERARAARPQLDLTADDASLIEICKRLDGLPLAIELAAARLRWESVQTLLEQLSAPLSALIFGGRDAPDRQRTMRAAIDWSFQLLGEQERTIFCLCALFVGSGSTEAISAVARPCSFGAHTSHAIVSLADKHLLRLIPDQTRETRFEMLEVIREYARERLDSVKSLAACERAFAYHYDEIVTRETQNGAAGPLAWMELVTNDYSNIRVALRWSVEHDRMLGLRLALRLPKFWERKGLYAEAREWLEALIDPLEATIERADPMVAWRAVNALGLSYYWTADAKRACVLHQRALAIARALNDPVTVAKSLNNFGIALLDADEPERARRVLEESLTIKEGRDDPWSVATTVGNLGIALRMCASYEDALKCHRRAHDLFRSIGDTWGEIGEMNFIADVHCDRRDDRDAASCYARSLEANTEGIRPAVVHSLEGLATLAARRHEFRCVAVLAGAVDRIWRETGRSESSSVAARFQDRCAVARASLGDSSFDDAWNDGAAMSLVDAIEVGRAIGHVCAD